MIDFVSDVARVNGTTLAYSTAGPATGRPVVAMHSLFMNREMTFPVLGLLAKQGYRVFAFDHRGQGGSGAASRDEMHLNVLAADAAAFIQLQGLAKPHIAANSLGGMVALKLAAERPDLVGTVTALGSSAEIEHRRADFDPLVAHLTVHGMKGDILTEEGPVPVRDVVSHIMFGDWTLANNPVLVNRWGQLFDQLGPSIGDAAYNVVARESVVAKLRGCTVPVLAIAGDEDHAYPQPVSGHNIAEAAGGRHVTIPNAGHSVMLEQTEAVFNNLLLHFARFDTARVVG